MKPYYDADGITIYHGDCREILPTLPKVDLVLTDPPYGLNKSWGNSPRWQGSCGKGRLWNGTPVWDAAPPDSEMLLSVIACGTHAILWGGNYFEGLSPQKAWLVWDKCAEMTQAQAELAWTNLPTTVRIFRQSPLGVWGNGGRNGEYKEHPTQKPLALMVWCLQQAGESGLDGDTVIDPFMGSGTTLLAAKRFGLCAIGIETEEKYCEIAAKRIENDMPLFSSPAYVQGELFDERAA